MHSRFKMAGKPRILVAEDDADLLETLAEALEEWGAEVVRVETGADLLLMIQEDGPFDLVVTDVSLPWVDGLLVMRAVRRAGFSVPVIVITAHVDERIPPEVAAIGGHVVLLRKPFDLFELESVAASMLAASSPEHAAQ